MKFLQNASGKLTSQSFLALAGDMMDATGMSVFGVDCRGGLFTDGDTACLLWDKGEIPQTLFSLYSKWSGRVCIYAALSEKPGVFLSPGGMLFGVVPVVVDDACHGAFFFGPARPSPADPLLEERAVPPEGLSYAEADEEGARLRGDYPVLRMLYEDCPVCPVRQLDAFARIMDRALFSLVQKNLMDRVVSEYARHEAQHSAEAAKAADQGDDRLLEKLRYGLRRHVFRECAEILKNRIYEIYEMETDEERRFRMLGVLFLTLSRVGGEFHAPIKEAILKDVESDAFLQTLTKGQYFVAGMAEGYLVQIFRATEENYEYRNGMEKSLNYIDIHIREDISLEQAATAADLNSYYFSKMFKKTMGVNFITYLSSRRMDIAGEMLAFTDLPVSDIAEEVSYGSEAGYFSKSFKKYFGVTPRDYRQLSRAALQAGHRAGDPEGSGKDSLIRHSPGIWNRHQMI